MKINIRKLLVAVKANLPHRFSWKTYEEAINSGLVVYESTFTKKEDGSYGQGYVLTSKGEEALKKI